MANPLFEAITGGRAPGGTFTPNIPDAMSKLRADPLKMIREKGFDIPPELAGNPQAAVMHLLQTGQVSSPILQRIQPFLNMFRR